MDLALRGDEHAGVTASRPDLEAAFDGLGLQVATAGQAHGIDGPVDRSTTSPCRAPGARPPTRHDPDLSDHALYVVRAERP